MQANLAIIVRMQFRTAQLATSPLTQGVPVHPADATQAALSQKHLKPCPGTAAVVWLHEVATAALYTRCSHVLLVAAHVSC